MTSGIPLVTTCLATDEPSSMDTLQGRVLGLSFTGKGVGLWDKLRA